MKQIVRAVILVCTLAVSGCFYGPDTSGKTLRWELVGRHADTVSVFTSFIFAFSEPIVELDAAVESNPPYYEYAPKLNATHDTVTIITSTPLMPSTRYVLRRKTTLHAADGQALYPEDDSLVFFTHPSEMEYNNTFATADTLVRFLDNTIYPKNDTDMAVIVSRPLKLTLASLDARIALRVIDSVGTSLVLTPGTGGGIGQDTLALPDTLRPPLYCVLTSQFGVAGSRYVLGAIYP
jgi:hypothetical protein